jgi:UDP-N-acetylglucosamine acyltransferase
MPQVHATAIVDPAARIGEGVSIGPFCTVGANVELGANVRLMSHVVVDGHTRIGSGTVIHPFASIGLPPQHVKYRGEPSRLVIGTDNIIREHVTMHTGTAQGGMETRVGNDCFLMVGAHIAHDCLIDDNVILTNGVALGGHVHVGEFAIVGGLCGVHQYVRIGKHAMVGGCTGVDSDIIPYGSVKGNRAKLVGLNLVGLKRRGFSRDDVRTLRAAYGLLFSQGGTMVERINEVVDLYGANAGVMDIVNFLRADSSRALCSPDAAANGNGNGG